MKAREIQITGCVSGVDGRYIDEDDFWTEITSWFESKGYAFGGGINAVIDDDDPDEILG